MERRWVGGSRGAARPGARISARIRTRVVAALAAVAVLTVSAVALVPAAPASGAIEDTRCVVEPALSTGTQSGVPAVAVGEEVRLGTEVDLEAGTVYQDILANPDGSTYVSTWLAAGPAAATDLVADLSTLALTIDGVDEPLAPGTEPRPDGFVLDTSGAVPRVLFPGDPAVLADPTGTAAPSYVVPPGGQTFRLTYLATVPDLTAGTVTPAVVCQASISYGEANAAVDERDASVAVLGVDIHVDKTADLPVLAPSTVATYAVEVSVPAFDSSGEIRNGTAYDVLVTDELPTGLTYVPGSASHGGTESAGVLTWTIGEIAAGASETLTYQLAVPADAVPGAVFTNEVAAVGTSLPGDVPGEATSPEATDSVELANGAEAPTIEKSSDVDLAGTGQVVTFTVDITWPPGSTWHDVTITDLLPDGFTLADPGSFTCSPEPCPALTPLAPYVSPAGTTRFGWFLLELGPFADEQTWSWTSTATMTGAHAAGAPVALGTVLDNLAEVRFNLIPRLGGATPNPARLTDYDGVVDDVAPVEFNRPVIAIDKAGPTPSAVEPAPDGVTYTVTLTNTGGVDATGVRFTDPGPSSSGHPLGTVDGASVTGAAYAPATSTFTVPLVPANGSTTVTYRIIGAPAATVAVEGDYDNTATVTAYGDPAGNDYTSGLADVATITVEQPDVTISKERLSASPVAGTDGQRITYRVTLSNTGDADAYDVEGTDVLDFPGSFVPGTCTGDMTISAAGELAVAHLPAGADASCTYDVELDGDQPEGTLTNTATITWRNGFGQTGVWSPGLGVVPWTASDGATTTVVHPQLVLQKGPEADTPGNIIPNGETGTYTLSITNVSAVTALNVELSDTLPAGLSLESAPSVTTVPDGIAHTLVGAGGDTSFGISFDSLDPGDLVQVTIVVRHDGDQPADEQLANTATLTADGVPAPLTDTGVLVWVPNVELPTASKAASPAAAGIGEEVTWTVTATVRENTVELYDVAFVDSLPRGMTFGSYGTVDCLTGPLCATVPSPATLTPVVQPNGETRLGWFVGDVPADTADTTYQFTFTATVAAEYSGTGAPPAGAPVTDTLLINRVQPWLTLSEASDDYDDGSLPDLAVSLPALFEHRGPAGLAAVHAVTPKVVADKEVTNLGEIFDWSTELGSGSGWMAEAGDEITYDVVVRNVGGATAYDLEIADSMGQLASGATMLRDVVVGPLPAGVTVIDGWTLADPDVVFHIDELAAGASVTLTYTGQVAPSEELVPGFSGDNRDVALIRNSVDVAEFTSAPGGGGNVFEDTFTTRADVYVYTPSPYLRGSACVGGSGSPAGTTATFAVDVRNGAPPFGEVSGSLLTTGFPANPSVGAGHDTTLTVVLAPNVRYEIGTAEVNGATIADPAASIDGATSVQTLVFDLGELAQGEADLVTFDVRTIADGAGGGMVATATMLDASGAPSRGTASPGSDYEYRHAIARGCGGTVAIQATKYPDLSYRYEGQKQFEIGEVVEWFGSVGGASAPFHGGELVDRMPDGIDYTPGTAELVVTRPDLSTVVVSAANGNLTEVVTPLADGRTELRFTSPELAEFRSLTYRIPSVVASDAVVGATLTNVLDVITSDGITGNCSGPTVATCDNGSIQVISSATPTLTKTVDHPAGPWGDSFAYTVDVTFPADMPFFDAFVGDRGDYPRQLDGAEPFAATSIECLSGCAADPAPVTLPVFRNDDEFARAWYLGDLALQPDARIYRITYQQTFVDPDEYLAEFGVEAATEEHVNTAVAGWNDTNVLDDAAYQPGGGAHAAASSRTLAISSAARAEDEAGVALVRPELAISKVCEALDGRDDLAESTSTGHETTGGLPNFRCALTASNASDPALATTITDPVLIDTLPTASSPDGRPVTTQVVSWSSDELLVDVEMTAVPGSPLVPPAASSLRITAEGLELAPGESMSVTVDLRVAASSDFWDDGELRTERSTNTLEVESFGDLAGYAYSSEETDDWHLVIEKPKLTVSQRAWAGDGYEESLADPRPTACMAYVDKPEPINGRIAVLAPAGEAVTWNECSNLKDARSHESSPGGEYARSYGGGAPDVVPGVTDQVTWAVDTAVVAADDFPAIAVTDQIPYGFEYVPGSARLAHWGETGTSHTPLPDPVLGTTPAVECSRFVNFFSGPVGGGTFHTTGALHGQHPWTPLTWNFAAGATGAAGAFWDDALAYLHDGNRGAAGALDDATPFDRMVRVVFDVRPRAEFADCLQTPQRANSFRSEATATGTHARGTETSTGLGWVVGVQLVQVSKGPDDGVVPDGTTATYDIDVAITDPTRLDNVPGGSTLPTNIIQQPRGRCPALLPTAPTRTPWLGLGDLSRNGIPLSATFTGTSHGTDFATELVITDVLVDDGRYVPGSATVDMFDPWGRPFAGHLASESVEEITVDGRLASRVTWTFDSYPAPANITTSVGVFPCSTDTTMYITFPSSLRISVPLDIPDGTPDGTTHPNTVDAHTTHLVGGEVVREQGGADEALVTVRNPLPPPPATKTAVPDEVAPGERFEWIVEAELAGDGVWFDLGWTDEIPASMELLGYGTPTCVVTASSDPCSSPALVPATLTPVVNGDGSTTVGWYVGDVTGIGEARTLRLPVEVRFVGDEVDGDELTNVVTGYSNDDDLVDVPQTPPDLDDFAFRSEPVVGVATVIEPSVEITKDVANGPGPFQAGDTVAYEITVANTGTATAYDVPIVDTPDHFLTNVTTASPFRSKGWTALDPRVKWFLPTLDPGEVVVLDVAGVVADGYLAAGVSELANTATVTGYWSRPEDEADSRGYGAVQAEAVAPLIAQHLSVEKYAGVGCTDPAQTFAPDEPVSWCVVVANTGDAPAHNVTLADLLPPGWVYDPGSAGIAGAPAEPAVSTTASGNARLEWSLGDVAPGDELVITYRTIGVDSGELVTNTAVVDSTLADGTPVPDPAPGFRDRDDAHAVPLGAGLQIAKLPDEQRIECHRVDGCEITWELVVVNGADLDLTGAAVVDDLPAGLTYVGSVAAAGWDEAVVGAEGSGPSGTTPITWTHPDTFGTGSVATFELTALVPPGTGEREYLNHAVASADDVPDVENQALASAFSTASLGDLVWHDENADGRQDEGEEGIPGVTVQLYDASGAAGAGDVVGFRGAGLQLFAPVDPDATPLATTVTDGDGWYAFTDLQPGSYALRFLAPSGWVTTLLQVGDPDGDSDVDADGWTGTIRLASGTDDPTWDAGLYRRQVPGQPGGPTTTTTSTTTTTAPPPGGSSTSTTVPGETTTTESGVGVRGSDDENPPAGGVGGRGGTALPRTGEDLLRLVVLGLGCVTAGWLTLRARRQRIRVAQRS